MRFIYLVHGALASQTTEQIFLPKIRKLYLITDYIQNRDQKSEDF